MAKEGQMGRVMDEGGTTISDDASDRSPGGYGKTGILLLAAEVDVVGGAL